MPSVLFIPDRFMDYRMWGEVPDLIRDRTSVVHLIVTSMRSLPPRLIRILPNTPALSCRWWTHLRRKTPAGAGTS